MSHGIIIGSEADESLDSTLRCPAESQNRISFGATNSSQPNAGSSSGVDSNATASTDPASEDERVRLLRELESSIESFRGGKVSKTDVIADIIRILGENTYVSISQSQKESTFDSYLTEILSIQSNFDQSSGSLGAAAIAQHSSPNMESEGHKEGSKRGRDDAESDFGDDDNGASRKRKLVESDMPWYVSADSTAAVSSRPSCQETCRLLRSYNRDVSRAKFLVKLAPNCPTGIPSSQWERIFKGDAVDLNQVFASLHHVVVDEERTGRLGETEISFGVAEPKKKVRTAAEWSSAWRRASKAITFAFPHRREELLDYGDYIESEFAAKVSSSHHKLILYDIALRNEVAGGQSFLLSDHERFSRLYSAIVLLDGVEGHTDNPGGKKPGSSRQGGGKSEMCNKFNAGTCKHSSDECKYLHACKKCRKLDHGKKDCPDGSK